MRTPCRRWVGPPVLAFLTGAWWIAMPGPLRAQAVGPSVPPALAAPTVELRPLVPAGSGWWIELTPLSRDDDPLVLTGATRDPSVEPAIELPESLVGERVMLCRSARSAGVECEDLFLEPGSSLAVGWSRGFEVTGRYREGEEPAAGTRVAVIPAALEAFRPFELPLRLEGGELVREVLADEDGDFAIPELAPGEYFLEAILPSGRVHHSPTFSVPSPTAIERRAADDVRLRWPLGEIVVAAGLEVEFVALDSEGRPVRNALVGGSQGSLLHELVTFEGRTGAEGRAVIGGFEIGKVTRLTCLARGFLTVRRELEQPPAVFECLLERPAAVIGELLGPDGLPVAGATVILDPAADEEAAARHRGQSGFDGRFEVIGLEPARYRLVVAAPGYEPEELEVEVISGERRVLSPLFLLPAGELEAEVRAAASGSPIAGAEISAVEPAGASYGISDELGRLTLAVPTSRPTTLRAIAEGYAPQELLVTPEALAEGDPLVFELRRGGRIAVAVDRDGGGPCVGCPVRLTPGREELMTDGAGEARSGLLDPRWYGLEVPGVVHRGSTVVELPRSRVRYVRVEEGETAYVWLEGGGAEVELQLAPGADPHWVLALRTPSGSRRYQADADGRYRVRRPVRGSATLDLEMYDPESAALAVVRQGSLTAAEGPPEQTIALSRAEVRGRVESDGEPVAGERVRLFSLDAPSPYATVRTAADGSFRIPHPLPGVYTFLVGNRPFTFVRVEPGERVDIGLLELPAGSF